MPNNRRERDYAQYGDLPYKEKIVPGHMNVGNMQDGYPGMQGLIRNIMDDQHGPMILQDGATGDFEPTGTYGDVDVDDGYIITQVNDISTILYISATTGLNIDAVGKVVVASANGTVSVKLQSAMLPTDVPIVTREENDDLVDLRNLNKGEDKLTRTYWDIIAGNSVVAGKSVIVSDEASIHGPAGFGKVRFTDDIDMEANDIIDVENLEVNTIDGGVVYLAATQSEITSAISAIGSGTGTIIITANITMAGSITISNSGASVHIKGRGAEISLTMDDGYPVFSISNCQSLLMEDISIDASAETGTTNVINITGGSRIRLRNVFIDGDSGGSNATGIDLNTSYVDITNVGIRYVAVGIHVLGDFNKISNCRFTALEAASGRATIAILVDGDRNIISNNIVKDCISAESEDLYCIHINSGERAVVEHNLMYNNQGAPGTSITAGEAYGIRTDGGSRHIVTGNIIDGLHSPGNTKKSFAFHLESSYCSFTCNVVVNVTSNLAPDGWNIYAASDYNTINGNVVKYDAEFFTGADNNIFSNNQVATITDGGAGNVKNGNKV
jgi:hypothetical protein